MIFYKNPVILSIFSGVLLTLSWPVQGLSFLIFFSLIPLFFVENQITKGSSKGKKLRWFALSYLGFFIWNLGTTWWIVNSSVFGMTFAVLCNTSFYAILMMLFHWSKKRLPLRTAYIFLVSLWIAFEKFHLMWDFSWPWLNLGNVFSEEIEWKDNEVKFGGELNFHGIELRKNITAKVNLKQNNLMLEGSFDLMLSDFEVPLPSFMLRKMKDEIIIKYQLYFKKLER